MESNKVAAMRVTGENVDANTAPTFFIPHVNATVDIACPTTPCIHNYVYMWSHKSRVYFYGSF